MQDPFPKHEANIDLSEGYNSGQKEYVGVDAEGKGMPSADPIASNPIGSSAVGLTRPLAVDQNISAAPSGSGQKKYSSTCH
jgi:hypothetical protein